MSTPTLGRTVHYRLSAADADDINRRRKDFSDGPPYADRTGYIGHIGNAAVEGAVCPAVIVRIWDEPQTSVNLQVLLDGNDTFWATSRAEGDDVGQWRWPERT